MVFLLGFWIGVVFTLFLVKHKQKKALKQFDVDFQRRAKKPFNDNYSDIDGDSDV